MDFDPASGLRWPEAARLAWLALLVESRLLSKFCEIMVLVDGWPIFGRTLDSYPMPVALPLFALFGIASYQTSTLMSKMASNIRFRAGLISLLI